MDETLLTEWLVALLSAGFGLLATALDVALESNGVYGKPVWNVLEGQFEVLLVNAQHIKAVPGRKTDQKDSEWIADLLQHGLRRGSFVPPRETREMRDPTRYRVSLAEECNRVANRIQKVLEDANPKLASVTDALGASGRAMLEAIVAGEQDSEKLAGLSKGLLRNKRPELQLALEGRGDAASVRLLGPSPDKKNNYLAPSTAGWRRAEEPNAPSSQSRMRYWLSPSICCSAVLITSNSEPISFIESTNAASPVRSCVASNALAIRSLSNRPSRQPEAIFVGEVRAQLSCRIASAGYRVVSVLKKY